MGKSKRIRRWIAAAAGVCLTAVSAAAVRFSPEPTTGLKKQPDI